MNEGAAKTSAGAIASLVLGILSVLLLGLLAGIPAVICGHMSLSRISRDALLAGRGLAIAGLIAGYVGIAWSIGIIALTIIVLIVTTQQSMAPDIYTLF